MHLIINRVIGKAGWYLYTNERNPAAVIPKLVWNAPPSKEQNSVWVSVPVCRCLALYEASHVRGCLQLTTVVSAGGVRLHVCYGRGGIRLCSGSLLQDLFTTPSNRL